MVRVIRRVLIWLQHMLLTIIVGFLLTYCLGTVLEMRARQSFLKKHSLENIDWRPGMLPRLLTWVVCQLSRAQNCLLIALGVRMRQQSKANGSKALETAKDNQCEAHRSIRAQMQDQSCVRTATCSSSRAGCQGACEPSVGAAPAGNSQHEGCCPPAQHHSRVRKGACSIGSLDSERAPAASVGAASPRESQYGRCCPSSSRARSQSRADGPSSCSSSIGIDSTSIVRQLVSEPPPEDSQQQIDGHGSGQPCQFSAAFHMELYDAPDPARQLSANGTCMPALSEALSEGCSGATREAALTKLSEDSRIEGCSSPSACSRRTSSDVDVAEAQEVCCGVEGEQAKACQNLLNKGKALDSKCKQLSCR